MVVVTESAKAALDEFFSEYPRGTVRVYQAPGGQEGPRLDLVMDEPSDEDCVFQAADYTFCMHAGLADKVGAVRLDCVDGEFVATPTNPFARPAGGCSGCRGGSCSSCC